jgi:hypothetical protein
MIDCVSGVVGESGSGVYIDFTMRFSSASTKGQSRTGFRKLRVLDLTGTESVPDFPSVSIALFQNTRIAMPAEFTLEHTEIIHVRYTLPIAQFLPAKSQPIYAFFFTTFQFSFICILTSCKFLLYFLRCIKSVAGQIQVCTKSSDAFYVSREYYFSVILLFFFSFFG